MKTLSVVLVGSPERRERMREAVGSRSGISVIGEIGDANALRLVAHLRPDAVLLDCAAPAVNALVALPWLQSLPSAPQVVAVASANTPAERRLMLELGALSYASLEQPATLTSSLAMTRELLDLTPSGRRAAMPAWLGL